MRAALAAAGLGELAEPVLEALGPDADLHADPWLLLTAGASAAQADALARALLPGVDPQDPRRGAAHVVRLLQRAAAAGSTAQTVAELQAGLVAAGWADPLPALRAAAQDPRVTGEDAAVCLVEHAAAEEALAEGVARLLALAEPVAGAPLRQAGVVLVLGPVPAVDDALRVATEGVAALLASGPFGPYAPLPAELVLVEGAERLDVATAAALVEAVADGACLVLAGDPDVLPTGPGQVLRDLRDSGGVPVVPAPDAAPGSALEAFRAGVRRGALAAGPDPERSVVLVEAASPEQALHRAGQLVGTSIPRAFDVAPEQVLVLSPALDGPVGRRALAAALPARVSGVQGAEPADAVVVVLPPGGAGRDWMLSATLLARRHLSVVHAPGAALGPPLPRRTRLRALLAEALDQL